MNSPTILLGLDVGGTMIKGLLLESEGRIIAEETTPTNDDGTKGWLERARTVVGSLLKKSSRETVMGVAAPGLAAPDGRCIIALPDRLTGVENLNWQEWLGFPVAVPVFNDAQAALLGEVWKGAAQGSNNVLLLTLGTGVGGAAMVDGRILRGRLGRAGHVGHVPLNPEGPLDICNAPGSLEDSIGEHNVLARSRGQFRTTKELVRHYQEGSKPAAEIWLRSVRALAAALAGFINVLDPEVIVIGGGIADADEALFKPLQEEMDRFEWRPGGERVRIVKAELGRHAGAIGAAYGARLANDPNSNRPGRETKSDRSRNS